MFRMPVAGVREPLNGQSFVATVEQNLWEIKNSVLNVVLRDPNNKFGCENEL